MNVCRICLMTAPDKDVSLLETSLKGQDKSCTEIISFCLDIEILKDQKTQKLCMKCFKKIISFYKFKTLALKNDVFLRNLYTNCAVKIEAVAKQNEILNSVEVVGEQEWPLSELKSIKVEDESFSDREDTAYQSDDEVLSVIKKLKDEQDPDENEIKENIVIKLPKKRGRPKQKTKTEQKIKREVCEECGKSVWNLREHSVMHIAPELRKMYPCTDCDKVFTNYGGRSKHYKVKHLGIKQICDICNKEVVNLKSHKLTTHDKDALPVGCMLCGMRFLRNSLLEAHMLTHTKSRPITCLCCDKTFRTKLTMLQHKRQVHDKEKSHMCQFCSKSFFKKDHLLVHIRSHTKERPYECDECHKFFSSSTVLKNHKLIHTGVRNFHCHYCDSSFVKRENLSKHILSHTKEKKHPCKYCGVKFLRTDHRKRHEYTAHEKHLPHTTA